MTLLILAYVAGVLSILSPCILPVLPFVFCRIGQPFMRTGLPLLLGMAAAFAGVATLAAVGGSWAVDTNQYGRIAALVLLTLFAATLLSDRLAQHLARPLVALGQRLSLQSTVAIALPGAVALRRPRRRHGIAVGALRWPDPWPRPDGRRAQWRERQDLARATGIRPRRSDISWPGSSCRRPGVYSPQAVRRRGRMAAPRFGHCRASRRGRRRYGWDTQLLSQVAFVNTTSIEENADRLD